MKTETLLLIAGALGVGYLIAKKRSASDSAAAQVAAAAPRIATLSEPEGAVTQIGPDVMIVGGGTEYVPYPVPGWGPSWGSYRGGGGRRHRRRRR